MIGALVLLAAAGLAWTARLVHVSNLDALELAAKVSVPDPVSALDWPELRLRAVVPQPGDQPLVLLLVGWPAHPQRAATLLLAIDSGDNRSVPLLSLWCASQAPVSPTRRDGAGLELRRRQSLKRVHAVLLAEDYTVLRPPARWDCAACPQIVSLSLVQARAWSLRLKPRPGRLGTSIRPPRISRLSLNSGSSHSKCSTQGSSS